MQVTMRYQMKRKILKVEKFLNEMETIVPWQSLLNVIRPFYKKSGGRPPHDLELMLRIHFLQLWHNLSDPATEEAIYDRDSFKSFLKLDCFTGRIPDESSICRFRHLLESHNLSKSILAIINNYLNSKGLVLKTGTVVDATLLPAPTSKKNASKSRDKEMTSTKKNNKWYFGAKGHIGIQAEGKPIIHSTEFTTAKTADIKVLDKLYHGQERAVFGDSAYNKNSDKKAARKYCIYYGISDRGRRNHPLSSSQKKRNRKHSSIRPKVEHPFRVIKCLWGHTKLRYKGLKKNESQFTTLCALSNLYFCRKDLIFMA